MEKQCDCSKTKRDPLRTMQAAEQLLKNGDTDMAATYFWFAGQKFQKEKKYELSANAYQKVAYCYELDSRWEKAAEEYLSASKMYERAGSLIKAQAMKHNAEKMKKTFRNGKV